MTADLAQRTPEELARMVVEDDPRKRQAFEQLYVLYFARLSALSRQQGVQPPTDEEVANVVMFKLWQQLEEKKIDLTRPLQPWLTTVTKRESASHFRRPANRPKVSLTGTNGHPGFEPATTELGQLDRLLRDENNRRVQLVMESLKPEYATALQMRHAEHLGVAEIAEQLSISKQQTYRLLDNARRGFHRVWAKQGQ